jgi:homospermidine synthase
MQVAISVVAASMWMMENQASGIVVPDDLPHDYILKISKPYLGKFISTPSDWTPLRDLKPGFGKFTKRDLDHKDPWQFKNFLINQND